MFADAPARKVYLPAGDWFDFWTRAKISGGKAIDVTNGRQTDSAICKRWHTRCRYKAERRWNSVEAGTCFDITVNVVGEKAADFSLCEDDGLTISLRQRSTESNRAPC